MTSVTTATLMAIQIVESATRTLPIGPARHRK